MSSAEPDFLDENKQYHLLVRFDREYYDDVGYAKERMERDGVTLEEALRQQFGAELQDAYDELGMAGHYEIVEGPVAKTGSVKVAKPCWSFMAYVLLSNDHFSTPESAASFWEDFALRGCVDYVLTIQPYQHLGLGWVCSVAFLVMEEPDKWLRRLRNSRGAVLSVAVDELCGPVEPCALPSPESKPSEFYEKRWPEIEGMLF